MKCISQAADRFSGQAAFQDLPDQDARRQEQPVLSMDGRHGRHIRCGMVFFPASAANWRAIDAWPSKVEARQIPKIALIPSKRRPALVDKTLLICWSAGRTGPAVRLHCKLQGFDHGRRLAPVFLQAVDEADGNAPASRADASPPRCQKGWIDADR